MKDTVRINISLKKDELDAITKLAKENKMTRSKYMVHASLNKIKLNK